MLAQVIPFRAVAPRRPVARDLCVLSEQAERLAAAQIRIAFAWQRVLLRAWWGV